MSVYQVVVRTLSPIHIGDGLELRQDFDFAVYKGSTYRFNEDMILSSKEESLRPKADGRYPSLRELLAEEDFQNSDFFRYVLRGVPRSRKTDARVKSFIKDVYDRPYIPGSSLKGAIRTALAWTGWREVNPRLDRSTVGRNKSWAGQPLEKKIFGRDPNHDLLRALHMSDLFGPTSAGEGLALVNAQVLTRRSHGSPVELEALVGDLTFTGSLSIDESLFSDWAEDKLHFKNRRHWLEECTAPVQSHSRARIDRLVEWFESAQDGDAVARFYRQLASANLGDNQALLQIGWGAGWDGKTFWTHLQSDSQFFEQLVRDFKMHKAGKNAPPRKPGDPFPRSRRAAMVMRDNVARPAAPFGWVLLELTIQ